MSVNPTSAQTDVMFRENAAQPPKPASWTPIASHAETGTGSAPEPSVADDNLAGGSALPVIPKYPVLVAALAALSAAF